MTETYICAADLHFRPDKPPCRTETTEEWISVQFNKFGEILQSSMEFGGAPILVAGDFCHKATGWPAWLFSGLITTIKESKECGAIFSAYGQHDLPYHQLNMRQKSNLGVLNVAEAANSYFSPVNIYGLILFDWGMKFTAITGKDVAVTHQMVMEDKNKEQYPGQAASAQSAEALLRKYPQYKLIVSGDNHLPFAVSFRGRWLLNPGSMTRQRTTETHAPGFYIWQDGEVERRTFKYDPNAVREQSAPAPESGVWGGDLTAVEDMMNDAVGEDDLDFHSALQIYFNERKTRAAVQEKILGE